MKKRLDIVIAERGLCKSRSAATELIKREGVMINGVLIKKPSTKVDEYEQFDITPLQFVSRGGLKLEHALTQFDIDVSGKTAIDIGSSTGGFTDCLLQRGIEKVIAIDVGTNQLDQSIKDDPRVELHEKTDIRTFKLKKKVDIAVIDVSFISILKIIPEITSSILKKGCIVALIKPQFEVGRENLTKKGIVKNESATELAIANIKKAFESHKCKIHTIIASPIAGGSGNTEYLLYATF